MSRVAINYLRYTWYNSFIVFFIVKYLIYNSSSVTLQYYSIIQWRYSKKQIFSNINWAVTTAYLCTTLMPSVTQLQAIIMTFPIIVSTF